MHGSIKENAVNHFTAFLEESKTSIEEVEMTTDEIYVEWDIKVPIKEQLKNCKPFPVLSSYNAIAIILSFVAKRPEICQIL